jgi:ATP-dependent DNA helicase RecQ
MPTSLDQLAEVPGVGATKLERYGDAVLEVMRGV